MTRGRSDALWSALEVPGARFSRAIAQAVEADDDVFMAAARTSARKDLHSAACRAAIVIFDTATGDAILQPDAAAHAANARARLVGSLRGRPGRDLFHLPPVPSTGREIHEDDTRQEVIE